MRYAFFVTAGLALLGMLVMLGDNEIGGAEIIGGLWTVGLLIRGGVAEIRLYQARVMAYGLYLELQNREAKP